MKSAFAADAQGFELPLAKTTVETTELDGGFHREVFVEIIAGDLFFVGAVVNANVGVAHLSEVLTAFLCLVDRCGEQDFLNARIDLGEIDHQRFVVALLAVSARLVVAGGLHGAVGRKLVVVENEKLVSDEMAVVAEHESRGIEIVFMAGPFVGVPAEADANVGQAVRKADIVAF